MGRSTHSPKDVCGAAFLQNLRQGVYSVLHMRNVPKIALQRVLEATHDICLLRSLADMLHIMMIVMRLMLSI